MIICGLKNEVETSLLFQLSEMNTKSEENSLNEAVYEKSLTKNDFPRNNELVRR